MAARLRGFLDNPLSGLAPWIVMAVMSGIVWFEVAVALSLVTALVIVIAGALLGEKPRLLEWSDVVFFFCLGVVGLVADESVQEWLRLWADELSNIALVVIAAGSMLIRRPFTLPYARERVAPEIWATPRFIRTNYIVTGAWAAAFLVAAISGFYADAVLEDSDEIWSGWIIPTAAILAAVQFTLWYPRVVSAEAAREAGRSTDPPPPTSELLAGLIGYLPLVGIVCLVFDAAPWWVGVGLIVAGPVVGHRVAQDRRAGRAASPG